MPTLVGERPEAPSPEPGASLLLTEGPTGDRRTSEMKRGHSNGQSTVAPARGVPGSGGAEAESEGRAPGRDVRCHCGCLVARIVDGQLEIKCRRCQRIGLIRIPEPGERSQESLIRWRELEGNR